MGRVRLRWLVLAAAVLWSVGAFAQTNDLELQQCISSWRKPMNNGYIQWGLKNSCDVAIAFDIDNCDMDPDMQATCTVKTMTVSAHGDFGDSNYHQPANARNYRAAGGTAGTSSGTSTNRASSSSNLWNKPCPDHYFHAYPNGACTYCSMIWSNGNCIAD